MSLAKPVDSAFAHLAIAFAILILSLGCTEGVAQESAFSCGNCPVFEHFDDSIYESHVDSVLNASATHCQQSAQSTHLGSVFCGTAINCGRSVCDHVCLFRDHIRNDFRNFFDRRNMVELSTVFLVAAAFANTRVDENFRSWAIKQGVTEPDVACIFDDLGAGEIVLPAMFAGTVAACVWQKLTPKHNFLAEVSGEWSYRSFRSLLVGAPAMLFSQSLTGASRPGESRFASGWMPFNDDNGVSGHAFVGAIPFLVAAEMTDRPLARMLWYAGSGLAGYNRICNDSHFLSQVMLGWTFAHISVRATTRTSRQFDNFRMMPMTFEGNYGIGFEYRR